MATFQLEVVSATQMVWEGKVESLVVRTTEGDIGILANHEPLLALLEPSAAVAVVEDGSAEIFMVDSGFLSVADNRVSLLSQYAQRAREISLEDSERDLVAARKLVEAGGADDETVHRYHRAKAQQAAARRYQQSSAN